MLPFSLVQKLYAAHFPYSWITWEGKLWEDPENQPGLGALVRACNGEMEALIYQTGEWVATAFNAWAGSEPTQSFHSKIPEEAVANLWLSLPKPESPRIADHVDMPVGEF